MTKDVIKCPACNGKGYHEGVFIEYAEGIDGPPISTVKCDRCDGCGLILRETERWMKRGKELRQRRIDSRLTLRLASKELGILPAELSRLETGKKDNTHFDPNYERLTSIRCVRG